MPSQRTSSNKRGFTLMELLVAMTITTIIVGVLVSITSIAMDSWNRSRAELRAARQAKAMVDTMAHDLEALITRRGNTNEWLSAISAATLPGVNFKSTNAAELIFFSAATDRYNGQIGVADTDLGGDVSCVAYRLNYKDPITTGGTFTTFVLNRLLVDPNETFTNLLGKPDLTAAFASYSTKLDAAENFVCENIYQFTLTFHVEVTQVSGSTSTLVTVPVTIGQSSSGQTVTSMKIQGSGIITDPAVAVGTVTAAELKTGRVTAVEIAVTVLSDFGIDQLRKRTFTGDAQKAAFLAKNGYQYTKLVQVPGM